MVKKHLKHVLFDEELLKKIETTAKKLHINSSSVIRMGVSQFCNEAQLK